MSRVTAAPGITIDPFQPMLCTMASHKFLKIICCWNTLRFCGTEKVLRDGIGVVAERDLDWTLETMNITIIACSLVCSMLSHKRNKLLGFPPLRLEVIIV